MLTAAALAGAWLPGAPRGSPRAAFPGRTEQGGNGTDARPRCAERRRVLTPARARLPDVSFCRARQELLGELSLGGRGGGGGGPKWANWLERDSTHVWYAALGLHARVRSLLESER